MSGTPHSVVQSLASRQTAVQSLAPSCAVRPIDGKGLGVVAVRPIPIGARLLAEAPLVEHGPGMISAADAVAALPDGDRSVFYSLVQNEARFGPKKTVAGIFGTNSHPCHAFREGYKAIFPLASRINHSCDPNAVYKWNGALRRLTVHACRPIEAGEEIACSYGFADGNAVSRAQRRAHLKGLFGFDCACTKCMLQGEALRDSDARLAAIGDSMTLVRELSRAGCLSLPKIVTLDPATGVLAQLEHCYALMRHECPSGHFYGLECYLLAFVEYCEAAARRLAHLGARPASQHAPAGSGGDGSVITCGGRHVPAGAPRAKAATYLHAARAWAAVAACVTRDVEGGDSVASALWADALRDGCWQEDGLLERPAFFQRWEDAGLDAPLSARSAGAALGSVH